MTDKPERLPKGIWIPVPKGKVSACWALQEILRGLRQISGTRDSSVFLEFNQALAVSARVVDLGDMAITVASESLEYCDGFLTGAETALRKVAGRE